MKKPFIDFNSSNYDFFKNNNNLKNISYLTLGGSYAYGTNNENSDIDLRGFLIEDKKYLLGINNFEQFEDTISDTVIYGLKKFISLCTNANPNVIELLGTDEESIIIISDAGKKIRDNSHLFLTKKVISSFGNYAYAQLRRLSNALCHDEYDINEQEKYLKNTLSSQLEHFNNTYTKFDKNALEIFLSEENEKVSILTNIKLEKYPLRDFISIYSEMQNIIKTYNKINNRNRKKDANHLNKHAMHLIRLLITGLDILNGKGIITRRKDEHELLMDIRNGNYSYNEIFKFADKYQKEFETASLNTKLPKEPDLHKIENLQISIYEKYLYN